MEDRRLVRIREVENLTGLKKSALYKRIAAGSFPVAVKIGEKAVAWRIRDVLAWIDRRPWNREGEA